VRYGGAIGVGWTVSGLLLGAALGGVYSLATGDWSNGGTWTQLWLTVGLFVVAVAIGAWCLVAVLGASRVKRRNGTAYILQEQARGWDADDAGKFLAQSKRQFARVIQVPGPVMLDNGWGWALDDEAALWDRKLDELAVAFRALHHDDDPESPNGIFMWAWWSVAMAFGMRVTAAERGLLLDVWKRPSFGRTPQEAPVPWATRPHSFGDDSPSPAVSAGASRVHPAEFTWPIRLDVSRKGASRSRASRDVAVLLVRVGRKEWGGIPDAGVTPQPEPDRRYDLDVRDAAGTCHSGKSEVVLHELRYDLPIGTVPWHDYPALVAACADWIVRTAGSLPGHTLLLGMNAPPEVALGLGIRAGQVNRSGWPSDLRPLQHAADGFVVPRLNLGTAALNGDA
jgi:hypothetical protein